MLEDLLARLLGGTASPNRLAAVGMSPRADDAGYSYGPGGAYAGGAPIAPQAAPPMAAPLSQAPMPQPMGQPAPQARSGGLLGGLFGGGRMSDGRNETIAWLQNEGLDEGTATLLAGNKTALQKYLLDRTKGADPKDALELENLQLTIDEKRNPTTDDIREYQFAKSEGYKGTLDEWRRSGAAKPAEIAEYEYAVEQGFKGTLEQWKASMKGGMSLQVNPETGEVSFQQGGNIKPLTEGQSKDTVYATKAAGALPIIDKYGDALTSSVESAAGSIPVVGNYLKSEDYQKAEQAGNEFLMAILRKETGAAITSQEMAEYGATYLPQPGDGPDVLAQKKASRQRALDAIKAGMSPQAILAQERALAQGAPAAPAQTPPPETDPASLDGDTPPPGWFGDPDLWKFMPPEDRKLFMPKAAP